MEEKDYALCTGRYQVLVRLFHDDIINKEQYDFYVKEMIPEDCNPSLQWQKEVY